MAGKIWQTLPLLPMNLFAKYLTLPVSVNVFSRFFENIFIWRISSENRVSSERAFELRSQIVEVPQTNMWIDFLSDVHCWFIGANKGNMSNIWFPNYSEENPFQDQVRLLSDYFHILEQIKALYG